MTTQDEGKHIADDMSQWRHHLLCLILAAKGYILLDDGERAIPILDEALQMLHEGQENGDDE